jgi:hypothetical protein
MTHRSRTAAVSVLAVLALLLTAFVATPSYAKQRTRGKVSYGTTRYVAGTQGFAVSGKVSGGTGRRVLLQVRWADGWHRIDTSRTRRKGTFTIAGNFDWYGTHKLRVVAPPTRRFGGRVFKAKKFKLATAWAPRGAANAFDLMSYKGFHFQWNPCETIKYRINPGYAGAASIPLTQEAMTLLERATGFRSTYVGTTTAVPITSKKYPRGTDLVIAWSHQDAVPELLNTVGRGGPGRLHISRQRSNNVPLWQIEHPGVTMNWAWADEYPRTMDDPATETMGIVLIHELGHAFGLNHYADGIQIMHPGDRPPGPTGYHAWYEAGDLAGLRIQGAAGGCLKKFGRHGRTAPGTSFLDAPPVVTLP